MAQFQEIPDAQIFAFPVPSIPGVGLVGGFDMQLQDRSGDITGLPAPLTRSSRRRTRPRSRA